MHLILVIFSVCIVAWVLWYVFGAPTSYPGPERPKKLRQVGLPKWPKNRQLRVPSGWRFVSGEESHEITENGSLKHNVENVKLSGEPAGRGIWVFEERRDAESEKKDSYHFDVSENPNSSDLIFRSQMIHSWQGKRPDSTQKVETASEAVRKGFRFFQMLQCSDGHWAGDYGGPMFLLPGMVITLYISGTLEEILPSSHRLCMMIYLRNHQQEDGGWGTHIESPSTMKGTVLNYVALRILGASLDDPDVKKARKFIQDAGGAIYTSSWAKFWLACLGVMEWSGLNTVPPEMWLLPRWFPFHPSKLWCHCRMVYLPMCWLYGSRFCFPNADTDPLVLSLRKELYNHPYESIPWSRTRHYISPSDNYSPIRKIMKIIQNAMAWYEQGKPQNFLRRKALAYALDYIHAEDLQTNYIDIGPVNKAMNMLCVFASEGNQSRAFRMHCLRVADYLWVAEDGMKMQGYNGSQCWDTSFAVQALSESDLACEFPEMSRKVWNFLERTQILSTPTSQSSPAYHYESDSMRKKYFRHVSQGGWPFSTSAHGWPISDCTAEALKGVLALRKAAFMKEGPRVKKISDDRLFAAVHVLLTLQNNDGGWATYENNRGWGWYEWLNPSEVFGDIMIDYSYVECSSSSIVALAAFRQQYPNHRSSQLAHSISRGADFIRSIQRPDGSWYGSWGCCFTYGTWFGIDGLVAAGQGHCKAVKKAIDFLLARQNENGGWGESFDSCFNKSYSGAKYGKGSSNVVCTAWALLGLMSGKTTDQQAVDKGIGFLVRSQRCTGDWPQEDISGVFNRACGITYTSYRNVFPLWALARYETYSKTNTK